jgi:diguanylate cyclase (GGDEF)-like protein
VANSTDSEGGYKLAEKIRRLVEEKLFEYGDIKIKITAGFGVHCMKNVGIDLGTFIELADKNLYEAKRRGRNKTIG